MDKVAKDPSTVGRKADHIRINLEQDVQFPHLTNGFEHYTFMHQAVPELDLAQVDTRTRFLTKDLRAPVLISSMTGGTEEAYTINCNLALAAQELGIAMGLGSLRAAIEHPDLAGTFYVRDVAPDILLFANLGAVQLNYGYGVDQCRRAVEMAGADALILHLNVLQEAVQPEGDTNFGGLLAKIEQVCRVLEVPVIAKEVGWGLSAQAARQLVDAGVQALDVAGSGGTSWSQVEYYRAKTEFHANVAASFADWGIPTAFSLIYARQAAPQVPVIASGGVRTGIEVAKAVALGADLVGLAGPFLKAAVEFAEAVVDFFQLLDRQLRVAMLCAGAGDIPALKQAPLSLGTQSPPPPPERK